MPAIATQAGGAGPVIDLHGETWRTEPHGQASGRAEGRAACCQGCAPFDRWVYGMGGFASRPFLALYAEAREFAGPDRCIEYLDMVREAEEGYVIDMASGDEQATAGMVRELVRRLDAAAEARQRRVAEIRLAADQAAIEACLSRSAEAQDTMAELRADPRVARLLDEPLAGPGLSPAEVAVELRAHMGLMRRTPTAYETRMPPVADLARELGVKR